MPERNKRGVLLFIVLATIIVVAILSTIMLRIMLSQSRLTHHQVSRIQAQYAAKAGMVMAQSLLYSNTWTYSPTNTCPNPGGCVIADTFPPSIVNQRAMVIFCRPGSTCHSVTCSPPPGASFCIVSYADFTSTP